MYTVTVMFFYFNLPSFVTYIPDPGDIKTLDFAISRLEQQEAKPGKLYDDLHDVKYSLVYFLGILGLITATIRGYRKALPDDEPSFEDDEKMITIFEEDKDNGR